jgi:hypothetical protein
MTTLHAQIDILKDKHPGNRQMSIKSLDNLLNRITALRMAGQIEHAEDNSRWTDKCNELYANIVNWRDELAEDPDCTWAVANDIETMMILSDLCLPTDMHNRMDFQFRITYDSDWDSVQALLDEDEPRRGDRSGAPSPEPGPR